MWISTLADSVQRLLAHNILAQMTAFAETTIRREQAEPYCHLVDRTLKDPFEVVHIWADKPECHTDEVAHPSDFEDYRNLVGSCPLLTNSFNASFGHLE